MISHILFRSSVCGPLIAWLGVFVVAFGGGWISKGCYSPVLGPDPLFDRAVERLGMEADDYEDSANELRRSGEARISNLEAIPSVPEVPAYAYEAAREDSGHDLSSDVSVSETATEDAVRIDSIPERIGDLEPGDRGLSSGSQEIVSAIQQSLVGRIRVAEHRVRELSAIVVQQQRVIAAYEQRERQYKLTVRDLQDSIKQYTRTLGAKNRTIEAQKERIGALEKSSKGNSLFTLGVFAGRTLTTVDGNHGFTVVAGVGLNLNPIFGAIVG